MTRCPTTIAARSRRPRTVSALATTALATLGALAVTSPAVAAQIVALDLEATGGASKQLAAGLNPILVTELAKREGMSVISQSDVRALLELEADKQALGCDQASCMTDIAGSLGAELLATSTLSKVGADYVVAITLIQVDGAKVIRRSSGRGRGDTEATAAVVSAVHELFRSGLPSELLGPASLSRRGFRAALAGLRHAVLDPAADPRDSRRRVVLDLVNTELDYDAEPKILMFDQEIRSGFRAIEYRILDAKTSKEQTHLHRALETYGALNDDLGRVKEIRVRSRERGVVPSSRPLRFEDPEPFDVPDEDTWNRYWKEARHARATVEKMVAALQAGDQKAYVAMHSKDRADSSFRDFENRRTRMARDKITWELLPRWGYTQKMMREAAESLNKEKLVVYALQRKGGEVNDERIVRLVKENDQWRVDYW